MDSKLLSLHLCCVAQGSQSADFPVIFPSLFSISHCRVLQSSNFPLRFLGPKLRLSGVHGKQFYSVTNLLILI